MTKAQLLEAAMTLPVEDREALAEDLLLSLPKEEREANDAAWREEARRRYARYEAGETTASPADEVIGRILARKRA
jgi:putative addiction module component (TIGR02574 family)